MITEILLNYLDDESISFNNKVALIKKLDLPCSDIITLMDIYTNSDIHPFLYSLLSNKLPNYGEQTERQTRDELIAHKSKRMKKIRKRG